MHLLIWFVDSVFVNAFCAAIVGLVYGPIFPSILALVTELIPTRVHTISMAIMYVLCVRNFPGRSLTFVSFTCRSCGFANLGGCKCTSSTALSQELELKLRLSEPMQPYSHSSPALCPMSEAPRS